MHSDEQGIGCRSPRGVERLRFSTILACLALFALPNELLATDGNGRWRLAGPPSTAVESAKPRAAVARIIVAEQGGRSYGSGTLVDVRDRYGLVVTNWHVVRDAAGPIEVVFPDGFRSPARALKVDRDWDLAALVIWRPPVEPVPIAPAAPRPGHELTIAGYGSGNYREATGRCTKYYQPTVKHPHELVELSAEARQGDSGGPIFNTRGELAGVLFGAGQGTTMGSYAGRVSGFLTSLAPDIGNSAPDTQAVATMIATTTPSTKPVQPQTIAAAQPLPPAPSPNWQHSATPRAAPITLEHLAPAARQPAVASVPVDPGTASTDRLTWKDLAGETWQQQIKSVLALIGALTVLVVVMRTVNSG